MNPLPTIDSQGEAPSIQVSKSDLLAAWSILENLAVSLDQIGGFFGASTDGSLDENRRLALLEALKEYLTPSLLEKINNARIQLGNYVDDDEAQAISETINYWNYETSIR
jgi:hypothetical protein